MIGTNIGTPKVALPNGLNSKRMKLEQSDDWKHSVYKDIAMWIYLNHCVFILRM